jgi:hypothetical protein
MQRANVSIRRRFPPLEHDVAPRGNKNPRWPVTDSLKLLRLRSGADAACMRVEVTRARLGHPARSSCRKLLVGVSAARVLNTALNLVDRRRHAACARDLPDEPRAGERARAARRLRGLLWVVFLFVLTFADYLFCTDLRRLSFAPSLLRPCRCAGRTSDDAQPQCRTPHWKSSYRSVATAAGEISSIINHAGASSRKVWWSAKSWLTCCRERSSY